MAHFSFPYYFIFPNSEFRIPKFALRISELWSIRNGQVVTAHLLCFEGILTYKQEQKAARLNW